MSDEIDRRGLGGYVYDKVKGDLETGALTPGQKLKLRDLAAELDVSITPVREALGRLVTEGALIQADNRSVRVPLLDPERYMQLSEIRAELEGMAAEKASERATPEDLRELEAIHQSIVQAKRDGDRAGIVSRNHAFHMAACRISRMDALVELVAQLWLKAGPVISWLGREPMPQLPSRHPHKVLIECLAAGDAVGARRAISQDIMLNAAALAPFLERAAQARAPARTRRTAEITDPLAKAGPMAEG
jgi:DNA-binding GntR family transcriptional regulator